MTAEKYMEIATEFMDLTENITEEDAPVKSTKEILYGLSKRHNVSMPEMIEFLGNYKDAIGTILIEDTMKRQAISN